MEQRIGVSIAMTMATLMLLAGCKNESKANATPSQVLARVNGDEITVNQLNYLLASQKVADDKTKQAMLDNLVMQDVLVQKAIELKLDRDPRVLSSIEFSRRQILAQAVVATEVGKLPDITSADVQKFYSDHPNLFEKHAVYGFSTFLIPAAALNDTLNQALDKAHSVPEVRAALQTAGVTFKESTQRAPAEQVPLQLLDKLAAIKPGDTAAMVHGDQAMLLHVDSVDPSPVALKDATPSIQAYIQKQRSDSLAKDKMELLKKTAKVEYVQQFASAPAAVAIAEKVDAAEGDDHVKSGMRLK